MGTFLLSIASPESLSWAGFVVLAIALIGEAAIYIIPKRWETLHREAAFAFALLAAGGYAIERVGDDAIIDALKNRGAARVLRADQAKSFIQAMSAAPKLKRGVMIGASPATFESVSFADNLVLLLRAANIDARRNDVTAATQVGIAKGIVARYTTGNEVGEKFANIFVDTLKADSLTANALDGLLENIMAMSIQQGRPRNSPDNEWVVIAIGDRS